MSIIYDYRNFNNIIDRQINYDILNILIVIINFLNIKVLNLLNFINFTDLHNFN